ncbi:hypothetical protein L7E55_09310 [Pelotomaculum isophthalicicum JI]|uniref:Uncharacterized protein n=1 Tax=Pelotomaculum isophthalicicum JI TaxID=947010 RepID=A0A9X4H865_9FIRM|nr:hypothetical protein [Pelotomaculum isophthalicicum]MDF9408554.1 hypothetical protein [Pelotomaculum isophthalicicum JI]
MVDDEKKDLSTLAEWFNELEHAKQKEILNYIDDNIDIFYELNKDEQNLFEELVNEITQIIIYEMDDKDLIIEKLLKYGFEKIPANYLYDYCKPIAGPYIDSKTVNTMSSEQLDVVMEFVINNIILYENYKSIPFNVYKEKGGFENHEKAGNVLRFINSIISFVCNRELSLSMIEEKLLNEFEISKELSDVIIEKINKYLNEMQQAYLLTKINLLLTKLSNLSCTYDD